MSEAVEEDEASAENDTVVVDALEGGRYSGC